LEKYFSIALIIISFVVIGLVMLQTRGSGLGSMFGGDSGIYRTRRGMEKTLYNIDRSSSRHCSSSSRS